jgi:hypothetical protein
VVRGEGVLLAELVFDSESLDIARDEAQDLLAQALNALCFTTRHKFSQRQLRRVVDWTPGLTEREEIVLTELPLRDVAEPRLTPDLAKAASRMLVMGQGERCQGALRWFRLGLGADSPDEQFMYFWLALEIVAEASKGPEKVPSGCPKCQTALYCETCGEHPLHRRFASDAIEKLINDVSPETFDKREIFLVLSKIRNTLMHGRRVESIARKLPCSYDQAINALAEIAWRGLWRMHDRAADSSPEVALSIIRRGDVTRKSLVAGGHVTVGTKGDPDNPRLVDVPEVKVSILINGEEPL